MGTRRQLLQGLGAGLIATSTVGPSLVRAACAKPSTWTANDPPWWLIAPLSSGSPLGRGWTVDQLAVVTHGAAVLRLSHRDTQAVQVHICAHSGQPRGVAHSALFDLVLMDGRQGGQPTDESLGRVLMQLARHIRRNELRSDNSQLSTVGGLLPHDERVVQFGPANLR